MVSARNETQKASSRVWTQVIDFIPYDDNRHAKRASYNLTVYK